MASIAQGLMDSVSDATNLVSGVMGTSQQSEPEAFDQPIWCHPAFVDMFADSSLDAHGYHTPPGIHSMSGAIYLVGRALAQLEGRGAPFDSLSTSFQNGLAIAKGMSVKHSNDRHFLQVLEDVVTRVKGMEPGDSLLVPGGWSKPPPEEKKDDSKSGGAIGSLTDNAVVGTMTDVAGAVSGAAGAVTDTFNSAKDALMGSDSESKLYEDSLQHAVLMVLYKMEDGTYSAGLCNTGSGLEFHSTCASSPLGEIKYSACAALEGIPAWKVEDSAFWWIFMKPLLFPNDQNGPRQLYEKVLPFLNSRAVRSNPVCEAEWRPRSRGGDPSHGQCVLAGLRFMLRAQGLDAPAVASAYITVLSQ
ncbi:hypothetical protein CYMTET_26864, partial [Cymbomonas tetramitiformis]